MQKEDTMTELRQLQAQIAALETELASYAFKYGLTDQARRLLAQRLHT